MEGFATRVFGRVASDSSLESGEGGGISRTESVASSPLFPGEAPPAASGLPSISGSPEKDGDVPSGGEGGISGGEAPAGEEGGGNHGGTGAEGGGKEGGVLGGKSGTSSMSQFLGLLEDETGHQSSEAVPTNSHSHTHSTHTLTHSHTHTHTLSTIPRNQPSETTLLNNLPEQPCLPTLLTDPTNQ